MWKAPTEIKKGLEYCFADRIPFSCEECPYYGSIVCKMHLHTDALAYIQQLENEVSAWKRTFSQIGDDGDVVQRELAHQRELIEKNVEMRRLEEAYHKLEAQVPRWISVEERLPEDRAFVLMSIPGALLTDGIYLTTTGFEYYDKSGRVWTWKNVDDLVTHWIPLPEPPKEDK